MKCVCQAQAAKPAWKIACDDTEMIEEATEFLKDNVACGKADPPEYCVVKYHVMQAHHDHCLHDKLPTSVEKRLHFYEGFYDDCFIKRQHDPELDACPEVACADEKGLRAAMDDLSDTDNDCGTECTSEKCTVVRRNACRNTRARQGREKA